MNVVVHPEAQDVVGKLRTPGKRPSKVGIEASSAKSAEVDMEVFEFPGPVFRVPASRSWERSLDPGARGPADLGRGRIK